MSTSSSGAIGNVLVIDANAMYSALRRGQAMRIITSPRLLFFTTLRTTWEVQRYLPEISAELLLRGEHVPEAELDDLFRSLPVVAMPESFYFDRVPRARQLIADRDPCDIDILALTLRLAVPLWTNDRHFDGIPEIRTVTTAQLLAALGL